MLKHLGSRIQNYLHPVEDSFRPCLIYAPFGTARAPQKVWQSVTSFGGSTTATQSFQRMDLFTR